MSIICTKRLSVVLRLMFLGLIRVKFRKTQPSSSSIDRGTISFFAHNVRVNQCLSQPWCNTASTTIYVPQAIATSSSDHISTFLPYVPTKKLVFPSRLKKSKQSYLICAKNYSVGMKYFHQNAFKILLMSLSPSIPVVSVAKIFSIFFKKYFHTLDVSVSNLA